MTTQQITFKLALMALLSTFALKSQAIDVAPATTEDVQKFDSSLHADHNEKEDQDGDKTTKPKKDNFGQRTAAAAHKRNEERRELKQEDKDKKEQDRDEKREAKRKEREERRQERRQERQERRESRHENRPDTGGGDTEGRH